ncbi:MAG TPA: OB-fold domain-containing protein [Acidimicrobiales bacterium]|nr:OB-fold domain-containing protein [Acidimicrobiales bacterium]
MDNSDEQLWELFKGSGVDRDSAPHFRGRLERRLLINRCDDCGIWHHPPKPVCPACLSERISATEVSGRGSIFLTVFLHQGPPAEGVDYSAPYPVVTVELDEQPGLRYSGTVVGSPNEEVRIGCRVVLDWIDRAGAPLPVFRLAGGEAAA